MAFVIRILGSMGNSKTTYIILAAVTYQVPVLCMVPLHVYWVPSTPTTYLDFSRFFLPQKYPKVYFMFTPSRLY